MESPVYPNVAGLAEALRSQVERHAHSTLSSESIADVANTLTELAATLHEDLNSRIPLFQLPVEILQMVLEHVPDPLSKSHEDFQPYWHSSAMDTSMLAPILQTCRQLRRVALSHVFLWKTISPTPEYTLPPIILQRDSENPLIAVIDGTSGDGVLDHLDEVYVHRMQELHIFDFNFSRLQIMSEIRPCFGGGLPLLESLSISRIFPSEEEDGDIDDIECPVPLEDAPRLRYMALENVTFIPTHAFPHLTHLALWDVDTPDCHTETESLLWRCPSLESLAIRYPYQDADVPEGLPHDLNLNHLRRVTLQLPQLCEPVMAFYLSFFPMDDSTLQPTALQILELTIMDNMSQLGETLLHITKAEAAHLSLALHPHPESHHQKYLTISAAGPKGTFHVSTEWFEGIGHRGELELAPTPFLDSILCGCAHLRAVREVWVTDVPPPAGMKPFRDVTEHFKATIAALPALETIVMVLPTVGPQLEVDLGLCPSARAPGFASPNLKALRIVYGHDAHAGRGSVEKVKLTKLLDQIGTGAYGHLEDVLLQMTRRLVVDGKDLVRLRARIRRVTFEHVDNMSTMPLPEYCTEPFAGPGGSSTWHGSLW